MRTAKTIVAYMTILKQNTLLAPEMSSLPNSMLRNLCVAFEREEEKNAKDTVKCSNCGFEYKNTMKFCPECGDKYNPCPKCGADLPAGAVTCTSCGYEAPQPCPHCGAALPGKNTRFCPECGKSLIKTCPSCNSPITGTPKFCPECGTKIE